MPRELWVELVGGAVLGGLLLVVYCILWWTRQHRKEKYPRALVGLVGGIVIGVSAHTVWRIENYCAQSRPHVDCVPDRLEGPIWQVYFPVRRVYRELRAAGIHVDGSMGTVVLPSAGSTRSVLLPDAVAQDLDLTVRLQLDKLPSTGAVIDLGALVRRVSAGNEYRGRVRILSDGSVRLQATKLVSSAETALGSEVGLGSFRVRPGSWVRLRSQVAGRNPATLRLKVWADGQLEPSAWQYSVVDSEAVLQAAGASGLRAFASAKGTTAPYQFRFDDLLMASSAP